MSEKLSSAQRRRLSYLASDRGLDGLHNNEFRKVDYVKYDPATGEVTGSGNQSVAGLERIEAAGIFYWLPAIGTPETSYVDLKTMRVRLKKPCPAVQDGNTIRDVPVPCRVRVFEETTGEHVYDWNDPEIVFEPDHPGDYTITIESVPHKPGVFTVTVDG